jgi:hypothetical protein
VLHQQRHEIVGGTIATEPDGWFTETVAFRSEAEARAGESKEVPQGAAREQWDQEMAMMTDLRYLDLHTPWFSSTGGMPQS